MKWLALILLVANAVYFGWELDRSTRIGLANRNAAVVVAKNVPRLSLLGELGTLPETRTDSTAPQYAEPEPEEAPYEIVSLLPDISVNDAEAGAAVESCFTFGPLPEERQALWLGDWFRARDVAVAARETVDSDRKLFWVYLAPEESREDALAVLAELQGKGISDMRLIGTGGMQNAISLGLFSTQAAVNARLKELEGHGRHPVVVPYADVQKVHWLDVRVTSTAGALQTLFSGYPSGFNSVPVKCSEIAIGNAAP